MRKQKKKSIHMERERMRYPLGVQSFEKLRREGMCYVDKTALLYEMTHTLNYVFLSRPRRFGKSLFVSTLEAYFEGKRELFSGLAIEKMETEWKKHPVFHLDLNAQEYNKIEDLEAILDSHLNRWEDLYGKDHREHSLPIRFSGVIRRANEKTGSEVVILVDEYDKPLALNLANEELQDTFRSLLKAFYGVMKSCDRYIRMGFLTGVTKFSRVSVFSDLNNITDISMSPRYNSICGMTEQEIHDVFDSEVEALAQANNMQKTDCYAKLRRLYDGYHFCHNSEGIYNPYSLLNTLQSQQFGNYWAESGTPTQLVQLLKMTGYNLNDLLEGEASAHLLGSVDSLKENPVSVIFQSGYLTIKSYDERFQEYLLGFPNEEVEAGFMNFLLPLYTNSKENPSRFNIFKFVKEVESGQPEAFMNRLSAMMADTDYRIVGDSELYFQNFLFTFFRLLGLYVEVERATSNGRMDMIVKTSDYIYIMEFKLDKTADIALQQIEEKGYARPFISDERQLYKIGINFSSTKRCVDDWKIASAKLLIEAHH